MGYQETLVKFNREKAILKQLPKLKKAKKNSLFLTPYLILKANKNFKLVNGSRVRKGDVYLMIGGERFAQKTIEGIESELLINRCRKHVYAEEFGGAFEYNELIDNNFDIVKSV